MPWNATLPFPGSEEVDDLECIKETLLGPPGSVLEGIYVQEPLQIELVALIISTKVNGKFKCTQLDFASKQENFDTLEAAANRVVDMRSALVQFQSEKYTPPSCFLILEMALRWPDESADELLNTFFLPKSQKPSFELSPDPVEDIESGKPGNEQTKKTVWHLLPDQDMTPARRDVPEPSKFIIFRVEIGGTNKEEICNFLGWRAFDWNDKEQVKRLNKWRLQVNDRSGGEKDEPGKTLGSDGKVRTRTTYGTGTCRRKGQDQKRVV